MRLSFSAFGGTCAKRRLSTADGCDQRLQRFRVEHPFHPLCGQEFEQLSSREGLPEDRLYFEDHYGRAASIPKHFTDLGPIDPVIVMGRGDPCFASETCLSCAR
jgi:hypothetical protein